MKITEMKTNHLKNPLGYHLTIPRVSFWVEDTQAQCAQWMRVVVALDPLFEKIVYDTGKQAKLSASGIDLDFALNPRTRYFWRAECLGDNGEYALSEPQWFETAKMQESWIAKWITAGEVTECCPLFYKEFEVAQDCDSVRIYASALGLYEIYLDGIKVGDEYLAPGCTDYHQWIQYQTYGIELAAGIHRIEICLGDGWYKGAFGLDQASDVYGDTTAVILELVMTMEDGSEIRLVTDDSWMVKESAILRSSIYAGEIYMPEDTCEKDGFEDAVPAEIYEGPTNRLCARYGQPLMVQQTFTPEILHTPAGETVLDFGQNMAGFVRFFADEPKGTTICLQYGEILQDGNFYRGNLRDAKAEYVFVSNGIGEWVEPHFTYYGYRYVKVSGNTKPLRAEDYMGCAMYSHLQMTGSIHTDHNQVNQLISNIIWGQRSNYVDVPTDCPQRSERMGWTADAQVFSGTACFNMDSYAFLRKYCRDMYETQKELGHLTNVVPAFHENGPTCSVWGDAATIIPWTLYQYYGDAGILREQFDSMCRWVDSIKAIDDQTGSRGIWDVGFHFGDWLALDSENGDTFKGATEDAYIATAYYYYSANLVAKTAKILGKQEEAIHYGGLAEKVKQALQDEYFTKNGRLAVTTQTAYAVALFMDFAPEGSKDRLADFLLQKLKNSSGYLKTGFVGTYLLNRVLSDYGNHEMACKLLLNDEYPSWLYEVKMGATTVWERWNSVMPDGTMNSSDMNSLNHYAYGSVMEWMYRNLAGLQPLEEAPGFAKVRIAPQPDYRIHSCEMSYGSISGRYQIQWNVDEAGDFHLEVQIPFGCEAQILLPNVKEGKNIVHVKSGHYQYDYTPDTPILKQYSVFSSLNEIAENPVTRAVFAEFCPTYEHIPKPMWDMPIVALAETPFVTLSDEERETLNARLK